MDPAACEKWQLALNDPLELKFCENIYLVG